MLMSFEVFCHEQHEMGNVGKVDVGLMNQSLPDQFPFEVS